MTRHAKLKRYAFDMLRGFRDLSNTSMARVSARDFHEYYAKRLAKLFPKRKAKR